MTVLAPLALMLGGALVMVLVLVTAARGRRVRTDELRALAGRTGWGFQESVPYASLPRLDRFELFDRGRGRTIRNVLTSPGGDPRAVVFDYAFVTGAGKNRRTHRQTVFYAASDRLALPGFSLRPENLLHRVGQLMGYQDIDLERRPEFSSRFLLRGESEAAIRGAITDPVATFFEKRPGTCAAGLGRELVFWRPRRFTPVSDVEALIRDGYELAGLMGAGEEEAG